MGKLDQFLDSPAEGDSLDAFLDAPDVKPPLPTSEFVGKKFKQGALKSTAASSSILGGIYDLISGAGVNPDRKFAAEQLRDKFFGASSGMRKAATDAELGVGTDDSLQSLPQKVGGIAAEFAPTLASMFVNPALGLVPASLPSISDATDNLDAGLSLGATSANLGVDTAGNALGVFLPPAVGKTIPKLIASGIGINVAQGAATDAAKNVITAQEDEQLAQKYDPLNPESRIADAMFGLAGAAHSAVPMYKTGRRAAAAQADQARNFEVFNEQADQGAAMRVYTQDFDKYAPILEANGITSPADPRAPSAIKILQEKQAATAQPSSISDTIIAGNTAGDAFVGDTGAFAGRGEAEARLAGEKTPNMQETMARTMQTQGLTPETVAEAFTQAMSRQSRADADLANTNQIAPDYQGGLSASTGGQFSSGTRTVYTLKGSTNTFEAQFDRKGMPIINNKGEVFGSIKDSNGNVTEAFVPNRMIKESFVPENQRLAQDYVARSSKPPAGVGVETMAGEKMPRRSTDRISGDEIGGLKSSLADPYTPEARAPSGETIAEPAAPKQADAPPPPRQGITIDGKATRVADNLQIEGERLAIENNGSGESSASAEAISRENSRKASGEQVFTVDPNRNSARPVNGVDTADTFPQKGMATVRRASDGSVHVIDNASNFNNEGLTARAKSIIDRDHPIAAKPDIDTGNKPVPEYRIDDETPQPAVKPDRDARISEKRETLKQWLPDMDWAERGGKILRDYDTGEVTGRTVWRPKDYEFDAIRASEGTTFSKMQEAVNRAVNGEKLSQKQQHIVDRVMDLHDHITDQQKLSDADHASRLESDSEYRERVEQQHIDEVNRLFDDASYDWKARLTDEDIQTAIESENTKSQAPESDATTSRADGRSEDSGIRQNSPEPQQARPVEERADNQSKRNDTDRPAESEPVRGETERVADFSENDLLPKFLNNKGKIVEVDGVKVTPKTALKYLDTVREEIENHKNFINCMRA